MWYCAPSSSCFPAEMNTSSIRYWMHMHIFSFVAMKQKKSGIFGVSTTRILFIQRHFYLSMELLALLAKDMLNTVFHVIYWEHTALHILYYNKNNPNASGANIFLFYFLAALALKIFRAIGTIEHIWTVMPIVEHRSNNTWGFRNKYTIFTIAVTATIRFVCLSSLQIMNECQHAKTIRYSKCTARGEQTNWGEFAKPKKKKISNNWHSIIVTNNPNWMVCHIMIIFQYASMWCVHYSQMHCSTNPFTMWNNLLNKLHITSHVLEISNLCIENCRIFSIPISFWIVSHNPSLVTF